MEAKMGMEIYMEIVLQNGNENGHKNWNGHENGNGHEKWEWKCM